MAVTLLDEETKGVLQHLKDDLPHYASRCLKIRAKSGELVNFRFNPVQDYVHDRLEAQKRRTGRVRALVLKARQEGVSSYVGARFYHRATFFRGVQVYILTHEQEATNTLFGMIDRFHRHVPALVKPETGASNSRELIFPGLESGYGVGTAGSKAGVGRSRALTLFHGSECAFWPSAKDHIAGVIQAVPYLEGTEIVLESTANGIGGEFHERWQQSSAGDGDYEAIFCPWFWDASYQRPPPLGFEVNDEEEEYGRLYKLTLPQLAWRRAKMAELGDVALWNQEYPADAQGAFQATGHDAYIPSALVMAARKRTCEAIGSLVLGVDPARLGDDGFAVCWRQGRKVHKVERRYKLDTIQGANWIRQIIDDDNPARVFIDVGGQGAGVVDLLKDWGPPYDRIVVAVNFGSAPEDPIRTGSRGETLPGPRNRRAEMYMRGKAWLQDEGGADLPEHDNALHADAIAASYHYDARQFLVIESKEDIRKRGLRSPDGWDSLILSLASHVRPQENDASDKRWRRKVRSLWGA